MIEKSSQQAPSAASAPSSRASLGPGATSRRPAGAHPPTFASLLRAQPRAPTARDPSLPAGFMLPSSLGSQMTVIDERSRAGTRAHAKMDEEGDAANSATNADGSGLQVAAFADAPRMADAPGGSMSAPSGPSAADVERTFALVSRVGYGSDGSMRLEFGRGALRGQTVILRAQGKRVSLELEGVSGPGADELLGRAKAQLRKKGFEIDE